MPAPDIIDLDPASDTRFRDVYSRHHNRMMTRSGNLIRTVYHHVSGAQANVSAAEVLSLDASDNAQYDLILRNSTNPIVLDNLTSANVSTWSASSLLSLRQGTTSIRSANVAVNNLTLSSNAVAKLDNMSVRSFQRTLGAVAGDAIDICRITGSWNHAHTAELNIVLNSPTYATHTKTYKFNVSNNATSGNWHRLIPASWTCSDSTSMTHSSFYAVEIKVEALVTTLRLVRTQAFPNNEQSTFECTLIVYQSRAYPVTVADSTFANTNIVLSTTNFGSTAITQVRGNVGIGTDAPTETLTVNGNALISGNIRGNAVTNSVVNGSNAIVTSNGVWQYLNNYSVSTNLTLTQSNQPNITKVGTLQGVTVDGITNSTNLYAAGGAGYIYNGASLLQGSYIGWNTVGGGVMEFINKYGTGSGGFNFYQSPGSGSATDISSSTLMASIVNNAGGTTTMTLGSGSVNQVVRSTSSTSRIQTALVTTDASTGSITFPTAFFSAPMVFTQIIIPSASSGQLFGVMVHSVTSTGFSYKKYYQQGTATNASTSEDWYWLAIGDI